MVPPGVMGGVIGPGKEPPPQPLPIGGGACPAQSRLGLSQRSAVA